MTQKARRMNYSISSQRRSRSLYVLCAQTSRFSSVHFRRVSKSLPWLHHVSKLAGTSSFEASILVSRNVLQTGHGDCQGFVQTIRRKAVSLLFITETGKGMLRNFDMSSLLCKSTGSSAPCMVFDALQVVAEKSALPDAEWMKDLSHAAATGFIGE